METQACLTDADLSRLWEDDLDADRRAALEQHLTTCPRCRARWDQLCEGARYAASAFRRAMAAPPGGECPSRETLRAYLDHTLGADEAQDVDAHLTACPECSDRVAEILEARGPEAEDAFRRYLARRLLDLLVAVPEEADALAATLRSPPEAPTAATPDVRLPLAKPATGAALPLAAATGEGFSEQVLRQADPPFEIHLVQFGDQLRVTVRPLEAESPYRDCLARLVFLEGDTRRFARVVRVADGEGRCLLPPDQTHALRPEREHLAARLEPLVTLEDLAGTGPDAYLPILERLLRHQNPAIRRHTVEILSVVRGPAAGPIIQPLAEDPDDSVRAAVQKTLARFPSP